MTHLVYLARPIDAAGTHPTLARLTDQIAALSAQRGWTVYRPDRAFNVPFKVEGHGLYRANMAVLQQADIVVALLPETVQTVGVAEEVGLAASWGKPVVVFTDKQASWQVQGWASRSNAFVGLLPDIGELTVEMINEALGAATVVGQAKGGDDVEEMPVVGKLPTRAYADDAGFDLYVSKDTWVPYGGFVDIPCGTKVQLPPWTWGLLTGRSSTLRKKGLQVSQGVIDAGYRGELFAGVFNPIVTSEYWAKADRDKEDGAILVRKGERIAQLIILANTTRLVTPVEVQELDAHARGENGFGSSGA